MQKQIICVNKKARYDYFLEEKYECGIKLLGVEIKSIVLSQCNLKSECFCRIENGEVFVYGFHISSYFNADTFLKEDPDRPKKLLLHKSEILRLSQKVNQNGYTLVPTKVYISNGKAKMEIALARGKKLYDKRETIKKNDMRREIERNFK